MILSKGIGIKSQNTMQTSYGSNSMETSWRWSSRVAIEWKQILKHFYPYSDYYILDAVRIGIVNTLEFISTL